MNLKRKISDGLLYGLMALATAAVMGTLLYIIIYILRSSGGFLVPSFVFRSAEEGGIFPMVLATVYVVLASIAIALPAGVAGAVFLTEYSGESVLVRLLRLAIETLAGIPSIIYGLFGLLAFCRFFGFGQSIIAGALTLSIMILPVIIRTTEESLKAVPDAFREGALSLGAAKYQMIFYVVLPQALPGILTSVILAIGRVAGESAPVLLTVGLSKNIPRSIFESGRTMTIHLYHLTNEAVNPDDFGIAFATAAALIILVLVINILAKVSALGFRKKRGDPA